MAHDERSDARDGRRGPARATALLHPHLARGDRSASGEGAGTGGHRGSAPVLDRSSTYALDDASERALATGDGADVEPIYGRYGTATTRATAELIAALEGGEAGLLFGSGMAAIASALVAMVPAGGVLVLAREVYGGTESIVAKDLVPRGMHVARFDATEPVSLASTLAAVAAEHPGAPIVVWAEAISNPLLRVAPLRELAEAAHVAGARLVVDATFAAGMAIRPLEHGADLVLHSATKFLNGHSDVVAGAAVGDAALIRALWGAMIRLGGSVDPMAAWLLARGLRTLPVRWAAQQERAQVLAQRLTEHPAVLAVHYPGLPSHPDFALAQARLHGPGAMISLELDGGAAAAARALAALTVFTHATSLGGIESLASVPARSSHAGLTPAQREALGIRDGVIRLSVGLEDVEDLWADLAQALTAAAAEGASA